MKRRDWIQTSAGALGGAVLTGCASVNAHNNAQTPFQLSVPVVPIAESSQVFPVHRIYCIGRNYAAHAREMGSDPTREPPFFFQKPNDAIQYAAV
ncbi:MAG: FAA hydrolase family protein, partial [Betaproteobacteria bacterium]|nr:FAA hydrolase family protein [Betaproteobacteria bacterium]